MEMKTGLSWEEAQERCEDREDWRRCVDRCVFDTGWTKDQEELAISGEGFIWNGSAGVGSWRKTVEETDRRICLRHRKGLSSKRCTLYVKLPIQPAL